MPSTELLIRQTLIGMLFTVQVASSWLVIWNEPSPSIAHTTLFGLPTWAPMAAGMLKPMVPRPDEDMKCLGLSDWMN